MARVRWGCLRAANLFFGCGRRDDARATLAALRPVIPESLQGDLMATEVAIAFFEADVSTALRDGRSVLAGELSPLATVWAAMATACALAFSGRFAEVAAIAEQGLRAAESCESGPQRYALGLAEVLGQLGAGDLAGAEQVCRRYAARAFGVPEADAIVSALEGRVLMAHGKLPAACDAFTKSLWTMSGALPAGWVMLVASWLAQAAGARGESGMAAEALARAEAADGPQVAVFGPELELARAWVQAASDQTTAARDHARRAAWMARSAGASAVEVVALHAALRFGERSAATRLEKLSSTLDGPLVAAVRGHGLGLYRANGDLLDDAGMQFERLGATALAADAYAHAAGAHARAGARTSELESVARAQSLARQCGSSTPATRGVSQPLPITDREREIAGLVAAGLTNREVADCLGLSVRTVDGHLYRIFGKLGVGDRDQLKRLVGEPVIPTGDNPSRKRSSLQA
jgi:DNA-binding CsgD family transcriptional regulator